MVRLTILLLLLTFKCFAQKADSVGVDNNALLNYKEAILFNNHFQYHREGFDFSHKRILFVTGSSASYLQTKKEYFALLKKNNTPSGSALGRVYIFREKDKKIFPEYDAVIYYYTKVIFGTSNLKRIKRHQD
ncbi:hypothetical protein CAP35_02985 [Chitinophagaceae bacterium IBVUCB1]|nr:hypothetical protein CAP35_02985 [Chitinophagaceae bacterium IBVUCB1]